MEGRYLLPCSCGQKIPVEPRQAGQEIRCDCGASLEVPTMLGMAALEKAPSEPSHTPPSAPWGIRQGIVLLGTVIVLLALGMVIPLHLTRPALPTAEMIRQRTQTLSPFQSWRHWHVLRAGGPDPVAVPARPAPGSRPRHGPASTAGPSSPARRPLARRQAGAPRRRQPTPARPSACRPPVRSARRRSGRPG